MDNSIRPLTAKEGQYRQLLATHDWAYQYSDDGAAYRRGRDERAKLKALQAELDQSNKVWNLFAPSDYQRQEVAA